MLLLFKTVEQFTYVATALTDQNSIPEGIKRSLKSGNACYHSVHNFLSASLMGVNLVARVEGEM